VKTYVNDDTLLAMHINSCEVIPIITVDFRTKAISAYCGKRNWHCNDSYRALLISYEFSRRVHHVITMRSQTLEHSQLGFIARQHGKGTIHADVDAVALSFTSIETGGYSLFSS